MKLSFEMPIEMVEKALGMDNPEASIEIKNYIVSEFVRRHLKDIANQKIVEDVGESVRATINEEIKRQIGKNEWSGFTLTDEFDTKLKKHIVDGVNKLINEKLAETDKIIGKLVDSAFARFTEEKLDKTIEQHLEKLTKWYIETQINSKLKKLVEGLSNE